MKERTTRKLISLSEAIVGYDPKTETICKVGSSHIKEIVLDRVNNNLELYFENGDIGQTINLDLAKSVWYKRRSAMKGEL